MSMTNVIMKVEGGKLTITADLTKEFGRSKSLKSIVIATTGGNVAVEGHEGVKVGLNVYKGA